MWKPKQISTGRDFPLISDAEKLALEIHPSTKGLYTYKYIGEDETPIEEIAPPKEVKPFKKKGNKG